MSEFKFKLRKLFAPYRCMFGLHIWIKPMSAPNNIWCMKCGREKY